MESNKKRRQSNMDLWRIVAAFCLLTHHTYLVRDPITDYYGYRTLIFIDLFFIISGYYTATHFLNNEYSGKDYLDYYIKKFCKFLPYTTIAILFQYILNARQYTGGGIKPIIGSFYSMPLEMLLLSETYTHVPCLMPIWFLSAMFIAFPVFLIILRIKDKHIVVSFAMLYSLVFYNAIGISGNRTWPKDPLRALAGLLFGAMLFVISDEINKHKKEIPISIKWVLTFTECVCLILPVIVTFCGMKGWERNIFLMFAIGIVIMTSELSETSKFSSSIVTYLGELSMPIYIWQWFVGSALSVLFKDMTEEMKVEIPLWLRLMAFYLITIIVSAVYHKLVKKLEAKRKDGVVSGA